ncbi:MAG: hypothetical protein OJF61_001501 [Rhodanobacteraceae bacterium]|nr:MAG: hypothetical protein OJF61_001501 [Rhodanobacteraceae bacterium]
MGATLAEQSAARRGVMQLRGKGSLRWCRPRRVLRVRLGESGRQIHPWARTCSFQLERTLDRRLQKGSHRATR